MVMLGQEEFQFVPIILFHFLPPSATQLEIEHHHLPVFRHGRDFGTPGLNLGTSYQFL